MCQKLQYFQTISVDTALLAALKLYGRYLLSVCVTYTPMSVSALPCNQVMTLYVTSLPRGIAASKANMRLMSAIHCIWVQRRRASSYTNTQRDTYSTDPTFRSLLPIALKLTMKPSVSLSGQSVLSSLTIPTHPRQKQTSLCFPAHSPSQLVVDTHWMNDYFLLLASADY